MKNIVWVHIFHFVASFLMFNDSLDGREIASSFEATRVYFNHDIQEVKDLLAR